MVRLSLHARDGADRLPQLALTQKSCKLIQIRTIALSLLFGSALVWALVFNDLRSTTNASSSLSPDAPPALQEGLPVSPAEESPLWWRTLAADEDCDGECVSENDKDQQDSLQNMFLMVESSHLENKDAPRLKAAKMGWIVVYLFLILYMFTALAIVCDEFFVPALEAFVDGFGISMDVAGATFMAAGGSMPELFTSFIATFQDSSEIGFAAIVGSAVFNVLFVIAVCAIFSSTVLTLNWWPLARDCSFYIIALCTVVIVFGVISPNKIEPWEAIILLLEYISYCSFMKVNGRVQDWLKGVDTPKNSRVVPEGTPETAEETGAEVRHPSKGSCASAPTTLNMPSTFRKGIVHLLTQNAYLYETAGIAAVTQIQGSLEDTFRKLDADNDGFLSTNEIKVLLEQLGMKNDSGAVETALRRITRSGEGSVSFDAFKKWYIASEARIEIEVRRVFDHFDHDHSNTIDKAEIKEVMKSLGHRPTDGQISELMEHLCKNPEVDESTPPEAQEQEASKIEPETSATTTPGNCVTFDQFEAWYSKSLFYQGKQKQHEAEESAADGAITIDAPDSDSRSAYFWYIFTYPLVAVLFCTLPDVRRSKWQHNTKIAVLEFSLSLIWIGIFSNLLYECVVVVSNTMRIPPPVSAITVLAAGTSIPDLLSSYIVARNGEGDMAVSSSIGSNIFDVTVGLPLPWLCYCLAKGKNVEVNSDSLGFSVVILIGMLILVICTIVIMKWQMNKQMGYVMLVLYILFLVQNLCDQLPEPNGLFDGGF